VELHARSKLTNQEDERSRLFERHTLLNFPSPWGIDADESYPGESASQGESLNRDVTHRTMPKGIEMHSMSKVLRIAAITRIRYNLLLSTFSNSGTIDETFGKSPFHGSQQETAEYQPQSAVPPLKTRRRV
jgi:hypothetical protein